MSTRSRIGIEMPDGKVRSVYCHHDGYLSGVGKMLNDHYQTVDKVEELVELGDISSLSETVELTYPDSYKGWRDEDSPAREDETTFDFWQHAWDCGEEFVYLFERYVDLDGHPHYQWAYEDGSHKSLSAALRSL